MKRYIFVISLSILFIWSVGFAYYLHYTKSYKINYNVSADAIAVFAGGQQRINTAVKLLHAGYAPILFIAGLESANQLKNYLTENNVKPEQVILKVSVNTTQNNAREIANFIINYDIRSVRVVTSYYHMPVVLKEIRKFTPASLIIIPNPVFAGNISYKVLFKEYNDYLISMIFD